MNEPLTQRREDFVRQAAELVPDGPPAPYLIVVAGGPSGQMIRLDRRGTRIGRASDNTVAWPEESLSRYHAFLWADEQDDVWLSDLGSTNGSYRNGEPVPRQTPTRLRAGDRIRFGLSLTFKYATLTKQEEEFHAGLYERAVRDPLTGLNNRGAFLEQLGPMAARAAQAGQFVVVLMLDVDHFKGINDAHGHDAGDAVLRSVARVLLQSVRPGDLVARHGGEEFVVALAVPEVERGVLVAERIRGNLAAAEVRAGGQAIRATASIGLAPDRPGCPRGVEALISAADACLYRAKRAGRDRVVAEGDPEPPPAPGPAGR